MSEYNGYRKPLSDEEDEDIILPSDSSYRPLDFDLSLDREYEEDFETALGHVLDDQMAEEALLDLEMEQLDVISGDEALLDSLASVFSEGEEE